MFLNCWGGSKTVLMPYPTKPKGSKLHPCQIEIKIHKEQTKEIKAVKKANQQILKIKDTQEQDMALGSDQQQHQWHQKPNTSRKTQHIPEVFKNLPFFFKEDGKMMCSIPLNIIQGLRNCPHLQNI